MAATQTVNTQCKMTLKPGLLLLVVQGVSLLSAKITERGDDSNPLEAVVASQAQIIDQLEARLTAVESRLGMNVWNCSRQFR